MLAVGSFQYPAAQMHTDAVVDPAGAIALEVSTVPHETHVVLAVGSFQYPAAQMHTNAVVDPAGAIALEVSTVPHETHVDVAALPQCEAGHVVSVYVVHAEFATVVYGTDVSQRHSVKPGASIVPLFVFHVNVSPAVTIVGVIGASLPYLAPATWRKSKVVVLAPAKSHSFG